MDFVVGSLLRTARDTVNPELFTVKPATLSRGSRTHEACTIVELGHAFEDANTRRDRLDCARMRVHRAESILMMLKRKRAEILHCLYCRKTAKRPLVIPGCHHIVCYTCTEDPDSFYNTRAENKRCAKCHARIVSKPVCVPALKVLVEIMDHVIGVTSG